jgi:hypothetical protein
LGELRLKNLSRPVHAFSLRLPGIERGDALGFPGRHSGWAKLPSIAVVPFSNLSPESEGDYFAEGLVEDIIVTLSNIPELLVVARGSTMRFRRRAIEPAVVSEKLGVRYLLSGSVRRSGDRIRINPRYGTAARVAAASLTALGRSNEARQMALHHTQILPHFTVSEYAPRCPFKESQGTLYVERLKAAGMPD